jgi:hypothetical protein
MNVNPHRTPQKVFHEKVRAKAKELYRSEPLVITTFVQCANPLCSHLLFAFVSAQYPILKVGCPECGKQNHRRILSEAFINHNLFNLAKDLVLQEIHAQQMAFAGGSSELKLAETSQEAKELLRAGAANTEEQILMTSSEVFDSPDNVLTPEHLSDMKAKLDEVGHIPKVHVISQEKADAFGVEALQTADGDLIIFEDVARDFSVTE